jgi:hypothetical protein
MIAFAPTGDVISTRLPAISTTRLDKLTISDKLCLAAVVVDTVYSVMLSARGAMRDMRLSPSII